MGIQAAPDSEVFRGEQDIDRSRVFITPHALKRFFQRFREQNQFRPKQFLKVSDWLRDLLLQADYKNAVTKAYRVQHMIQYKEELFFFRNYRWQFIVSYYKNDRSQFTLKTVLWLHQRDYQHCLQEK